MIEKLLDFKNHLHPFLANVIVVAIVIVAGILLRFIITKLVRYYYRKKPSLFVESVIKHLHLPFLFFIPLLVLALNLNLLILEETTHRRLNKALEVALIIDFSWLIINFLHVLEEVVLRQYDVDINNNPHSRKVLTQLTYIKQLAIILIVIITISLVLLNFESVRKVGAGLLTSAGVAGIIIGFAAQKSIANLLAGFQIAFAQPIRYDDVVVVEGEWGRIEEIALTYVVVRIWDLRRLIVPINYFIDNTFQNWSRTSTRILGSVFIYADYSLPLAPVREKFFNILETHPLWDKEVKVLQVTNATERTMEIRTLMSARNASDAFDLRCDVREQLISYIQESFPASLPKTRAEVQGEKKENLAL